MENQEKRDIVEYVESEVLYLKIENASSFLKRIEKLEKQIEFMKEASKNLKNAIAMKITLIKKSYKKDLPVLEDSLNKFESSLPLSKEDFIAYVREKIKRERIKALEKLKEELEKRKEKTKANG